MNKGIYKLVINRRTLSPVPAWEGAFAPAAASGCGCGAAHARRPLRRALVAALAIAFGMQWQQGLGQQPAGLQPHPTMLWRNANIDTTQTHAKSMVIQQTQPRAILNWSKFNIQAGESLHFNQQAPNWAALNRIFDANPSRIQGTLTAKGQVYLINQNGIIFGPGAQVDVNTLVASSLEIKDSVFDQGILSQRDGEPAFSGNSGFVRVEAGAALNSAAGGRIMLFAPKVENNGIIATPDGQTLLAAGRKVYLAASEDPAVRGLLVEVDNGGAASNLDLGQIIAQRGNATLVGLAVNQSGRISATTAVQANGSIRLLARDTTQTVTKGGGVVVRTATRGGTVELGPGSQTVVVPDPGDTATIQSSQAFVASKVEVTGAKVRLRENAWIVAPGGQVVVQASANPSDPTFDDPRVTPNDSRIYFDAGSGVDVSGTGSGASTPGRAGEKPASVPMERNVVEAELRGNELRDSPVNRNGFLRGKTVRVDARRDASGAPGTAVADVSGYIRQLPQTIAEKTAVGGTVVLQSEGDIVLKAGATLDISGGQVEYRSGFVNTSKLITAEGKVVDIGEAKPDVQYIGFADIYQVNHSKWGVVETWSRPPQFQAEPGYINGASAGGVKFVAPYVVAEGSVRVGVTAGLYQRAAAKAPRGGTIQFGELSDPQANTLDYTLRSDVVLAQSGVRSGVPDFGQPLPDALKERLVLGENIWRASGLHTLSVQTNKGIAVDSGRQIRLAPGGVLALRGESIEVRSDVLVPSGRISMQAAPTALSVFGKGSNLLVANGVELGAPGQWVNDALNPLVTPSGSVFIDGGSVSLSARNNLILGTGSVIDVSGGAWLESAGALKAGAGGSISLAANLGIPDQEPHVYELRLGGDLHGHGISSGGRLSLSAGAVRIADNQQQAAGPGEIVLSPALFQAGGFAVYEVTARDSLTLATGSELRPLVRTFLLPERFGLTPSADSLRAVAGLHLLDSVGPSPTRPPASLALSAATASFGELLIDKGGLIAVDPGAEVSLSAGRQLTVLGAISSPGGLITLRMEGQPGNGELIGYRPEQTIWLGAQSSLSVKGAVRTYTDNVGLRRGDVTPGGRITIQATKGYVVAEAGAVLEVSGSRSVLDLPDPSSAVSFTRPRDVWSDAGSIFVSAREGILLDATFKAQGGSPRARGGAISLMLERADADVSQVTPPYPQRPLAVVVRQSGTSVPGGLQPGQPLGRGLEGLGSISADLLNGAGFDRIALEARNEVRLVGDVALRAREEIVVEAPAISLADGANAQLSAMFVQLGNNDPRYQDASATGSPGTGALNVEASGIDLAGNFVVNGAERLTLNSSGDIRLRGVLPQQRVVLEASGTLDSAGSIDLLARQVYPTTLSQFTLRSSAAKGTIRFQQSGPRGQVPYSAGGVLVARANRIEQSGTLRAPLGIVRLEAGERIQLSAGSLTSVSAEGLLIPFGSTANGREWIYDFGDRSVTISRPPSKQILLKAADLAMQPGASLDLTGGGDLLAFEFTAGPGGSADVLAASGVFAVLPGFAQGTAPFDHQYRLAQVESTDGGTSTAPDPLLQVGDRIYLSGAPGLSPGFYTLLPGHYALLPGAFSVQLAGFSDLTPKQGFVQPDGSAIAAGYRVSATGSADARWAGFEVASGTVVRSRAEYTLRRANEFFGGAAASANFPLPDAAGRLSLNTSRSLTLDGAIHLQAAGQGRGGQVEIAAPNLIIADEASAVEPGFVRLDPLALAGFGAETLLLGATSTDGEAGTVLDVAASRLIVRTSKAHPLAGPSILLAARDELLVREGAVVSGSANDERSHRVVRIGAEGAGVSGNGALLHVGGGGTIEVVRESVDGTGGVLRIEQNALVDTARALTLDATFATEVSGELRIAEGGVLRLGAARILIGTGPVGQGLRLDGAQLARLGDLREVYLKSYTGIDFFGSPRLGSMTLEVLALEAGALRGFGDQGARAHVSAKEVRVSNPDGRLVPEATPGGAGSLDLSAVTTLLGPGDIPVVGFAAGVGITTQELALQGKGSLALTDTLNVTAGRIVASAKADWRLASEGDLLTHAGVLPNSPTHAEPGAIVTLEGASVRHATVVEAPSGAINLIATQGDVTLAAGAVLSAPAFVRPIADVSAVAPAGTVTLQARAGDVVVESGATVDLRGDAGASAGKLEILALSGSAVVNGTLKGWAGATQETPDPVQGTFHLDVARLEDFDALNQTLENVTDAEGRLLSGGFTQSRVMRIRKGDVTMGASVIATAREFRLSADDGNVDVYGTIDARGRSGGHVVLAAGQLQSSAAGSIVLRESATILAGATQAALSPAGTAGDGGRVELQTGAQSGSSPGTGRVRALSGARIDVSKAGQGTDGDVLVRARRLGAGAGNDVAIAEWRAAVTGGNTYVEAFKVYTPAAVGGKVTIGATGGAGRLDIAVLDSENKTFMTVAPDIKRRLGQQNNSAFIVRPGVEVRSAANLEVSVNETQTVRDLRGWDLNPWRYSGEPGVLTLKAAGDLVVRGSISDGFARVSGTPMPGWTAVSGRSWSYRFVAGADASAADTLAVVPYESLPNRGDLVLTPARAGTTADPAVALIRTGTGSIELAAARDVQIGLDSSGVNLPAAAIYTSGVPDRRDYSSAGQFTPPEKSNYPDEGGDISIQAGRDVIGAATPQLLANWLFRQGDIPAGSEDNRFAVQPSWWIRFDRFQQNVGALGGGTLSVKAGRDIDNLSAVVPTTGRVLGTSASNATPVVLGGGDLLVDAGGDIRSGVFLVDRGSGLVRAGGQITSGRDYEGVELFPVIALGDGRMHVAARGDVRLETVLSPTIVTQHALNAPNEVSALKSYFFTYSDTSAVRVSSTAGSIALENKTADLANSLQPEVEPGTFDGSALAVYPPTVTLVAPVGAITVERAFTIYPAAQGGLEMLAGQSIELRESLTMSDLGVENRLPILYPKRSFQLASQTLTTTLYAGLDYHDIQLLHREDAEPVRIYAAEGDINGSTDLISLVLPKRAQLHAGANIRNLSAVIQNVNDWDLTSISAGGDVAFKTTRDPVSGLVQNLGRFEVAGPGMLEIWAGHDVDLGNAYGIVTRGNLDNPGLPDVGAAVSVTAGASSADFPALAQRYLTPTDAKARSYEPELVDFVRRATGNPGIGPKEAYAAFQVLPESTQRVFLRWVFFNELKETGRAATDSAGASFRNYERGTRAIATLFPGQAPEGDINLFFSQLKTERGGDIELFAPGGVVFAGLANVPSDLSAVKDDDPRLEVDNSAAKLGIFTVKGGSIRSFSRDDFLVNSSRVFTLAGGDILIWSSEGDIDAGKGAKTASAAPPPVIRTDAQGNTVTEFAGAVQGSGIGVLLTVAGITPGDVDLIAPLGEVNAGDAGIRAAGNLNIAAVRVVGADNIQVGGVSTGVPISSSGSIAASLGNVGNVAGEATKSAERAAQALASDQSSLGSSFVPSFISVEVIGLGEEGGERRQ